MGDREPTALTKLELQIMQVIWKLGASSVNGACSVKEVQEALPQQLAYTTVQTMLNILERKGKLKRKLRGRAYVYSAVVTEAKASRHAVRDLVDRMFGGSADELVMSLIKNRQIDPKRIAELSRRQAGRGRRRRMNALLSTPMLSWFLSYLFNALWQIPLLFAAAWLAARMLRRTDPRVEHRIWVGALLLQVMLPACDFHVASLWHALLNLLPSTGTVSNGGVHIFLGSAAIAGGSTLRLPLVLEAGLVLAWMCCIFYFAARLAWGLWQTHTLARSATRLTLTGEAALSWTGHCHRMGITLQHRRLPPRRRKLDRSPSGCGTDLCLCRPPFSKTFRQDDLDAVLAHELAHIQRRDFAKNLLYGLAALPIAWHPVAWRTRMRVAESRELVCDAMAADAIAAEAVAGRRQYAQSLLRLASILSAGPRVATLHAVGILSLNTDARIFERRIMSLTRKPTPISAARRILVAASCCVVVLATCASALALHTDVSAITPSAGDQASGPPRTIHVKGRIMQGQRISGDNPVYPPEARAKKIEGAVVIDATIGKDGGIKDLRVVKTPDPSLAESALKAVRTWRYHPYLLNGEPVEVVTRVNVVYSHCESESNCKKLLDEMPDCRPGSRRS